MSNHRLRKVSEGILTGSWLAYMLYVTSSPSTRDKNITEIFTDIGRTEQIIHNSHSRIYEQFKENDAYIDNTTGCITKEQDSTKYEIQLETHYKNKGESVVTAIIETMPNEKGEYTYRIIEKNNNQELFGSELKDATITIGKGKKTIVKGIHKNIPTLKGITEKAEAELKELADSRYRHLIIAAGGYGFYSDIEEKPETKEEALAAQIMSQDYNEITIPDTNDPHIRTYVFKIKGYNISPKDKIEIIHNINPRAEEETYKFSELERKTRKQIKKTYRHMGTILKEQAKEYKQAIKEMLDTDNFRTATEIEQEEKENKIQTYFKDINK